MTSGTNRLAPPPDMLPVPEILEIDRIFTPLADLAPLIQLLLLQ